MGGTRSRRPCQCLRWAKGPVQGKTPPRPWEEPFSTIDVVNDKREQPATSNDTSGHFTNRKSTKTENDNKEKGNV